eukprot:6442603-Prymnesium_polylepis.1
MGTQAGRRTRRWTSMLSLRAAVRWTSRPSSSASDGGSLEDGHWWSGGQRVEQGAAFAIGSATAAALNRTGSEARGAHNGACAQRLWCQFLSTRGARCVRGARARSENTHAKAQGLYADTARSNNLTSLRFTALERNAVRYNV